MSGFFIHIPFWTSIFLILNFEGYFLGNIGLELPSRYVLILLITISSLMDVLAYFGGKKYGKRKFLSNISPNKTLEGFLIALIGTPLLGILDRIDSHLAAAPSFVVLVYLMGLGS